MLLRVPSTRLIFDFSFDARIKNHYLCDIMESPSPSTNVFANQLSQVTGWRNYDEWKNSPNGSPLHNYRVGRGDGYRVFYITAKSTAIVLIKVSVGVLKVFLNVQN